MKRRMVYPDVLRALSCIAVVFLNTAIAAGAEMTAGLLTWAVPMFVLLSGMFFLDPNGNIDTREIIRKYIVRLLIASLLWGVVAMSVNAATGGVLQTVLNGSHFYLNFLFIMVVLYAFTPAFRIFIRGAQQREVSYIVLLGLVFGCFYPYVQILSGTSRLTDHAMLGIGFGTVYLLGWYLRTTTFSPGQLRMIYLLGSISFILTFRGIWLGSNVFTRDPVMMILAPDSIFIAVAGFLVVKNTLANHRLSMKVIKPIARIARLSFGIYLIHPILLAVICYSLNKNRIFLPIPAFILLTGMLLLLVSGFLTWLLKKIPKVGDYIV